MRILHWVEIKLNQRLKCSSLLRLSGQNFSRESMSTARDLHSMAINSGCFTWLYGPTAFARENILGTLLRCLLSTRRLPCWVVRGLDLEVDMVPGSWTGGQEDRRRRGEFLIWIGRGGCGNEQNVAASPYKYPKTQLRVRRSDIGEIQGDFLREMYWISC